MDYLSLFFTFIAAVTGVMSIYLLVHKPYFVEFKIKPHYSGVWKIDFTISTTLTKCHVQDVSIPGMKIKLVNTDYNPLLPESVKSMEFSDSASLDWLTDPSCLTKSFRLLSPVDEKVSSLSPTVIVKCKIGFFSYSLKRKIMASELQITPTDKSIIVR